MVQPTVGTRRTQDLGESQAAITVNTTCTFTGQPTERRQSSNGKIGVYSKGRREECAAATDLAEEPTLLFAA